MCTGTYILLIISIICRSDPLWGATQQDDTHLFDHELLTRRMPYSSYTPGVDRAALMLLGLLAVSKDLETLLQRDKMELVWALSLVAGVTLVVDGGIMMVRSLVRHGPSWCNWFMRKWRQWVTQKLGWVYGFDSHELLLWQQIFEQYMQVAVDFAHSHGTLDNDVDMLGVPCKEKRWIYYKQSVCDVLRYMATYMTAHEVYYRQKRAVAPTKFNFFGYAGSDADHICFLIACIAKNLHNIAEAFTTASTMQDLDTAHIQALYRMTLCMLKKVRLFLQGDLHDHECRESAMQGYQEIADYRLNRGIKSI